jgi:hypothetical protein
MGRERPDSPPLVAAPVTAEDRVFLQMMFEEEAEHARLHEELRGAATSLYVALIAGLLAFGLDKRGKDAWLVGGLIFFASILGILVNFKHYERYKRHVARLRGFRRSLEFGLSESVTKIRLDMDRFHDSRYPISSRYIKVHVLWNIVYSVAIVLSIAIIVVK